MTYTSDVVNTKGHYDSRIYIIFVLDPDNFVYTLQLVEKPEVTKMFSPVNL